MTSLSTIIEQSIKNLDTLPATVKKNLMEIRRLDAICQKTNLQSQVKVRQLINVWKNVSKDHRKKSLDSLKADFQRIREMSDEKIRLSEQTYELVDKYIIKLDNDTAKLNAAVRRKFANGVVAGTPEGGDTECSSGMRKGKNSSALRRDGKRARKGDQFKSARTRNFPMLCNTAAPLVDMPVDPNEPTYCICQQVSYGQMIMCDNKVCSIEWFHFACVGLTVKPRGKWFCEACKELRRRRRVSMKLKQSH